MQEIKRYVHYTYLYRLSQESLWEKEKRTNDVEPGKREKTARRDCFPRAANALRDAFKIRPISEGHAVVFYVLFSKGIRFAQFGST